jgi:hypothetical protein
VGYPKHQHTPSTILTPLRFILGEVLKVIGVLFDVVEDNDYLQFQILAEFKHVCEKMKFQLEAKVCEPLGKSFIAIIDGSSINFKQKFVFVEGMKLNDRSPTPPS